MHKDTIFYRTLIWLLVGMICFNTVTLRADTAKSNVTVTDSRTGSDNDWANADEERQTTKIWRPTSGGSGGSGTTTGGDDDPTNNSSDDDDDDYQPFPL